MVRSSSSPAISPTCPRSPRSLLSSSWRNMTTRARRRSRRSCSSFRSPCCLRSTGSSFRARGVSAMSEIAIASIPPRRRAQTVAGESPLARTLLIVATLAFLGLFLLMPLAIVFAEAFAHGLAGYFQTFSDPDVRAAIGLTLLVASIAVPMNTAFGIAAAWCIAKFDFRGKSVLITLIDLPFSVSPVVSGLIFVLVFGAQGVLGPWVKAHGFHIIFAVPGIVLATEHEHEN